MTIQNTKQKVNCGKAHRWHIDNSYTGDAHCLKCGAKSKQPTPVNYREFINPATAAQRRQEFIGVKRIYALTPK